MNRVRLLTSLGAHGCGDRRRVSPSRNDELPRLGNASRRALHTRALAWRRALCDPVLIRAGGWATAGFTPGVLAWTVCQASGKARGVLYGWLNRYSGVWVAKQVLGTAPACATFFRPADSFRSKGKADSYLETGIWQARHWPARSAPSGSPLPHLPRDWAHAWVPGLAGE